MDGREQEKQPRWEAVGLTAEEYDRIVSMLGREPNDLELGLFGGMWSEHCSYKSSRLHLKKLPTESPRVLVGPGENAGVLDIGDGLAVVAKIESHNSPSAIEPYEGAATGVGGIIRDIFTMGARPIAVLGSFRFGDPEHERTQYLVDGVIRGVGDYSSRLNLPAVGGEIVFEPSYQKNPLVNAMGVGIMLHEELVRGRAEGTGNTVFVLGARTGRDGIHGASLLASREFEEAAEDMRPTVQAGNPFLENRLIETCLELVHSGAVVGLNDLGAAGFTSAASEVASRAGSGLELDLDLVPRREAGMTPYEVMLSESQERMLVIVQQGREEDVTRICNRWGIEAAAIGKVTSDGMLRLIAGGETVAELPARLLTEEAPLYDRPFEPAAPDFRLDESGWPDDLEPDQVVTVIEKLLAAPNIASKQRVYRRFDSGTLVNTVQGPGGDAAVLRVQGSRKGIALATDGNGRYCQLNPYLGAMIAVAESARNVACTGAEPIGLTNCLNFGNPERPAIMGQLVAAIEGIADAGRALGIPVTGGNVSLYNESRGKNIYPTPIIGMVGVLDDVSKHVPSGFQQEGDAIVLIGECLNEIGGSEYLKHVHGRVEGPIPSLDLEKEAALHRLLRGLGERGLIHSAHDCSDGGLLITLLESSFAAAEGAVGFSVDLSELLQRDGKGREKSRGAASGDVSPAETVDTTAADPARLRLDALLFGETQSRVVVSCSPEAVDSVAELAREAGLPLTRLGTVEGDGTIEVRVDAVHIRDTVQRLRNVWEEGLRTCLS